MPRLPLDDVSRSSALNVGSAPNDHTGDQLRNGGVKLKQSLADANANFIELFGVPFTLTTGTVLVRATHNNALIDNVGASAEVQHTLWSSATTGDIVTFERVPALPGSPNYGRSPEVRFAPQAGHSIHGGALGKAVVLLNPGRARVRWNGTLWVVDWASTELDWEP